MRRSTFATRARKAKRIRAVVKVNTLKLALGVLVQRADPEVSHPLFVSFRRRPLELPNKVSCSSLDDSRKCQENKK
jgi:hypothetical protein